MAPYSSAGRPFFGAFGDALDRSSLTFSLSQQEPKGRSGATSVAVKLQSPAWGRRVESLSPDGDMAGPRSASMVRSNPSALNQVDRVPASKNAVCADGSMRAVNVRPCYDWRKLRTQLAT
jgi:hypothetical protein